MYCFSVACVVVEVIKNWSTETFSLSFSLSRSVMNEIDKLFQVFPYFLVEIKYCRSRRKNPLFEAKLEEKGSSDDEMKII